MIKIRSSNVLIVFSLVISFILIAIVSTVYKPITQPVLAGTDQCVLACEAENSSYYDYQYTCGQICNSYYGDVQGCMDNTPYYFDDYASTNFCAYLDMTPIEACTAACNEENYNYPYYDESCSSLCNAYSDDVQGCIDNTQYYLDYYANTDFCSYLGVVSASPEEKCVSVCESTNSSLYDYQYVCGAACAESTTSYCVEDLEYDFYDQNPDLNACSLLETPTCEAQCRYENSAYYDFQSLCDNICSDYAGDASGCVSNIDSYFSYDASTLFCSTLSSGLTITPEHTFQISDQLDPIAFTGTVNDSNDPSSFVIWNERYNDTENCTFSFTGNDTYTFSCPTLQLNDESDEGYYGYEIRVTDSTGGSATKKVQVEVDVPNSSSLVGLWRFDGSTTSSTDLTYEDISQRSGTTHDNPVQSSCSGHACWINTLDSTNGYISVDDSNKDLSFSNADSHFKVEATVYSENFAQGYYQRVIGKYNQNNDENAWVMGVTAEGGLYCGIWRNDNQDNLETNSVGYYLSGGNWNRIACEWDASTNTLNAYIDGSVVQTEILDGDNPVDASTNTVGIGARPTGGDNFSGLIDNLKIYSYNVTPPDTTSPTINNYDNFRLVSSTDTTDVDGNVSDTSGIQSVEMRRIQPIETDWDSCDLEDAGDGTTNYYCWTGPMSNLSSNEFEIRATDTEGNTTDSSNYAHAQVDVDEFGGLQLYGLWRMEDTNITEDIHGDNGSLSSGASVVSGLYGKAIDITSDQFITVSDNSERFMLGDSTHVPHFRVEASVYGSSFINDYRTIIAKSDGYGTVWALGIDPDGGVLCDVRPNYEQQIIKTGTENNIKLTTNAWNNLACDWNAKTGVLTAYLNGEVVATKTYGGLISAFTQDSIDPLYIGGGVGNSLNAIVDNVKLYYESFDIGDDLPPVVKIDPIPNADWVTDTTPTITGTITDADGVASAEYLVIPYSFLDYSDDIDDYNWQSLTLTGDSTSKTFSVILPEFTTEGNRYIYVRATDIYGNKNLYDHNGWIFTMGYDSDYILGSRMFHLEFIDNTAPFISLSDVVPNPTSDSNVKIRGTVKDSDLDTQTAISEIKYKLDNGDWTNATVISSSDDGKSKDFVAQLSNVSVGEHTVEVKAKDAAGNETGYNYQTCYTSCIDTGLKDEGLCSKSCGSFLKTNIQSVNFEVTQRDPEESQVKSESISLSQTSSVNGSDTTAIVGNSKARLPIDYTYTTSKELYTNSADFGALYGGKTVAVSNAIDGNVWLGFNDGTFGYYNTQTKTLTKYPSGVLETKVSRITEFAYQGNRYLAIEQNSSYPTIIYSLGSTPSNTSDDSYFNYRNYLNGDSSVQALQVDTRKGYPCFYGLDANSGTRTGMLVWVDTKGTLTDPTDDTYEVTGTAAGLDIGYVSMLFDQENDRVLMGDYGTGTVTYIDDQNTPNDNSDDYVNKSIGNYLICAIFDIKKDTNENYWFAGDCGVASINVTDLTQLSSTPFVHYFSGTELGGERPYQLMWNDNTTKDTEEILFSTREGSIFAYDYNGTYSDLSDDTLSRYNFPPELYGSTTDYTMAFTPDGSSAWIMMPGSGLYKVNVTRNYKSTSDLIIWPHINTDDAYIDHLTLNGITGNHLTNVQTYVSNDGGETWSPISIGDSVSFQTSDYQIQLKLVLNKDGNDTPEVLGVNISYATYTEDPIVNSDLVIDYPGQSGVGDTFITDLELVDDLGLTPNWDGEATVSAYDAGTDENADRCFRYEDQTVQVTDGEASVSTIPLCEGEYYFTGETEDGRYATGSDMAILGTSDPITNPSNPDHPLCGNGQLDNGEECDTALEPSYMCEDGTTPASCSNECKLDTTNCSENDNPITPIINDIGKNILDFETGSTSGFSLSTVANWAVKVVSISLLTLSLPIIPYYIIRALIGILYLLRTKKDEKQYGYVYDSVTKEPVSQAIVRIYKDGKLVQTDVTGEYGEFGGKLPEGIYALTVQKPQYKFPSEIVRTSPDLHINNVYTGSLRLSQDSEIVVAVPIDSIKSKVLDIFKAVVINRADLALQVIKLILFVGLLTYSAWAYKVNPNILNTVVMAEYGLVTFVTLVVTLTQKIKYGVVTNIFGNIMSDMNIGLVETDFDRLVAERVTDEKGQYRFITKPGTYKIKVLDENYSNNKEKDITVNKEPSIINEDLTITRK